MGQENKKVKKYESVRIWPKEKKTLVELIATRTLSGQDKVSEVEIVSKAVRVFCKREKRRLATNQ